MRKNKQLVQLEMSALCNNKISTWTADSTENYKLSPNKEFYVKSGFTGFHLVNSSLTCLILIHHHHHHQSRQTTWIPLALSLSVHFYLPSLLIGPLDGIQWLGRADERRFLLVDQHCVHKRTSLMILSLFYYQCPACLVCFTWMVCKMGGKWPYSCFFCRVLLQGLVQNSMQHLCLVAI